MLLGAESRVDDIPDPNLPSDKFHRLTLELAPFDLFPVAIDVDSDGDPVGIEIPVEAKDLDPVSVRVVKRRFRVGSVLFRRRFRRIGFIEAGRVRQVDGGDPFAYAKAVNYLRPPTRDTPDARFGGSSQWKQSPRREEAWKGIRNLRRSRKPGRGELISWVHLPSTLLGYQGCPAFGRSLGRGRNAAEWARKLHSSAFGSVAQSFPGNSTL